MDFKWLALLSFVVNVEQLEFPTFLFCKHRKFSLPILQAWGQVHQEDVKKRRITETSDVSMSDVLKFLLRVHHRHLGRSDPRRTSVGFTFLFRLLTQAF